MNAEMSYATAAAAFGSFYGQKLKGAAHVSVAAMHNKRTMYADGAKGSGIDPTRSHLNYSLAGPPTPEEVATLREVLRSDAGLGKPRRKDEVSAIEVVFSLNRGAAIDLRRYFTDCTTWAMKQFGGEGNILSSDVHLDEPAPHCHVLMLPLVNGKMNGSDLIGGRSKLSALQADFHANVASLYGLRRPPPKMSGAERRACAKQVHDRLTETDDAVQSSRVRVAICNAIERDPVPFMVDLGIPRPTRQAKTFKEIALSSGAGPKTEAGQARADARLSIVTKAGEGNRLGFGSRSAEDRTLSCVGFDPDSPSHEPPVPHLSLVPARPAPPALEFTRTRDVDEDPNTWDHVRGEHRSPPAIPASTARATAEASVNALWAVRKAA